MELPYLKHKSKYEGGGSGTASTKAEPGPGHLLNTVTDEMIDAFHRKDHRAFVQALVAFIKLMKEHDGEADAIDSR